MLKNGYQPRYPEDLAREEFVPKNLEFKEKLEQVMHTRDIAEELVLAAHEDNKLTRKLQYETADT